MALGFQQLNAALAPPRRTSDHVRADIDESRGAIDRRAGCVGRRDLADGEDDGAHGSRRCRLYGDRTTPAVTDAACRGSGGRAAVARGLVGAAVRAGDPIGGCDRCQQNGKQDGQNCAHRLSIWRLDGSLSAAAVSPERRRAHRERGSVVHPSSESNRPVGDRLARAVMASRCSWGGLGWRVSFMPMEPAAFIMERRMLLGFTSRAEAHRHGGSA